ncbi:hypothetical protein [Hyalangium sp.]|uniref:hypothetical protein n=1 Tax=Hyalangium sp. TaxID=2028555 RepID=UPI002D6EE06C|nr:hypothetical protein [Hyalangium sp.]HYH97492.1 hypothetical protein [Hyalangium sp.]
MRTTVLLSMGWTLLVSLPAYAELPGVSLYERGEYGRARKSLENDLRSKKLSKEERIKARLYLAAALHASGEEESARLQLGELVIAAPALKVDPILFPPEFVALAEQARHAVDAKRQEEERQRQEVERQRQEVERQRLEAERLAREEEEARNKPPVEDPQAPEPSSLQLRPELFGFLDPVGKGVGLGGAMTLELGRVDLSARVLAGKEPGVGAEVGFLLSDGAVQPRLALRGTAVPTLSAFGGGAVAGLRLAPPGKLTFLLDVGAEFLKLGSEYKPRYRSFVLSTSAGVGFDLF